MRKYCIIVNKYPNYIDPNGLVFVQQLVWQLADLGNDCTVICPVATNIYKSLKKLPEHLIETTENGNSVDVYFPKFFGLGQSHTILGWSPIRVTTKYFEKAILRTIKKYNLEFDVFYGHFAAPAGVAAARLGRRFNKPSFMAHGEATDSTIRQFSSKKLREEFSSIYGVIAVSSSNKDLLNRYNIVNSDMIKVFPNGYRPERFFKRDFKESRNKFNLDESIFLVGFVGSFDERKGILRLEEACSNVDDVYFVCAGKGKLVPKSDKCLFAEPIKNEDLPYFYSALDCFVLPTTNEGCCNAIVEALACGCPIISSDLPFNYDILSSKFAILVDPNNVLEIQQAIVKIKNDTRYRELMREGSLETAKKLSIKERAINISEFIESMISMKLKI